MSHGQPQSMDAPFPAEDQLLQEKKLECLTTMAAGIAHDFNNYLAAIMGNNDIVLMQLPEDSPLRGNVEQIDKTAHMALQLTQEIMLFTARGGQKRQLVNLQALVLDMAEELRSVLCKNVSLILPEGHVSFVTRADESQIRHIISDLVANAAESLVDFQDGRVQIGIGQIECDREFLAGTRIGKDLQPGPYGYIEVRDNGKGLSGIARERMFDPFFSTKIRGKGLGLPVVIGILRAHSGTIHVAPDPAGGTVVKAFLPAAQQD